MNQDTYKRFYDSVYARDTPEGDAHGWIQHKGSDLCIDLHCVCGETTHIDGNFLYMFQCEACGRKYAVGQVVRLIELTPEELALYEQSGHSVEFKTATQFEG